MLRFLHAGDLHLGSSFAAFSPRVASRRRERQLASLEQLFADATEKGAQMILLAGDVFDSPEPDGDLAVRFFTILQKQPVPVVIAPGNHDYRRPGGFWDRADIPDNVYVFEGNKLSCFDFPSLGAAVYGYAFTSESMPPVELGTAADRLPDRVSILLAHADLYSPISAYAPLTAGQIGQAGFSYLALGHIHNPQEPKRIEGSLAAYSGFFAGRGFDECGEGGALMVEILPDHVSLERLSSRADKFEKKSLDCTGALSGEELRSRMSDYLLDLMDDQAAAETALRLTLVGNVGISCRPDPASLGALGERFALFQVLDETLPIYDAGYLEKDPTMTGAFYRAMLPRLEDADARVRTTAAAALRLGLAALAGKEV